MNKEEKIKVTFLEKEESDAWIFEVKSLDGKEYRIISVHFSANEVCTYKGYQIFYPVDAACDEPSEYRTDVELEESYIILTDEDGEYYDWLDYELQEDEERLITKYIENNYEF